MNLPERLLQKIIQDNKTRTLLGYSSFGDLFFSEPNGYGGTLFSVLKISTRKEVPVSPDHMGLFRFEVIHVTDKKSVMGHYIKARLNTPFKLLRSPDFAKKYDAIATRNGLRERLKNKLGKLGPNEVFAHSFTFYNTKEPMHATVLQKEVYWEKILEYLRRFPRAYYSDIYDLAGKDTYGPLVEKKYYGHGFDIPDQLFNCINLKALAIWNHTAKQLDDRLLQLKNLNALALRNLNGLPQKTMDHIQELPYLVALELTNTDTISRTVLQRIPLGIEKLKSLRYFDFSGHPFENWDQVVQLVNIRRLSLVNCGLTTIAANIHQLEHLEELYLNANKIQELPTGLKRLKNLKTLRLDGNPLSELPEWIGEMESLEVLELAQTGLTSLPDTIVQLKNLKTLKLKKNPFQQLPKSLLQFPKRVVEIELRNAALYDAKAKAKMATYSKGDCAFEADFNLKLMVINELMYVDEVLLPKFDIWKFAKNHPDRNIDIEKEGYERIPEAEAYFRKLKIPMDLLIDIKELKSDGGDAIYRQIIPFWDGEDRQFDVGSISDIKYLPNLKATNDMNFPKHLIAELRKLKIKVSRY
ncbi:leucine-rich repeat domain-containing protein [Maribacter sp. 2-571]|uniref:leucine-rich repeat domain-containing protein n=1 Tax=Maribacter sp. 2-571 TaxID=3417569 RepID=UPI003D33CA7A